MKRDAVIIFLFALIVYPMVVVAAHYTQSYVIFRSGGASLKPPNHLDIDEIELATPDGERLHAWWMPSPGAGKTVLYFHSNGTNISHITFRLKTFREMGVNGLMLDYRGYGISSGRVKREQDIYTDGQTAWNFLVREKGIAPQAIIIWGRSIGGAVAAEIARNKPAAALVLESTFYSLEAVARKRYWFLPTARLLTFHFENGRKLKTVTAPVVIIHSVEDGYIPFLQARRLFDAASPPKYIIETSGSHMDSFDRRQAFFGSHAGGHDDREAALSTLMKYLDL
jgi:fermentation-respiration switch protein FrsA (DUF1100 family)